MKFNLRNSTFQFLDKIRGDRTGKHLEQIKLINENYSNSYGKGLHNYLLLEILNYTVKSVPYYSNLNKENYSFEDFPVVSKSVIRNNPELFKSKFHHTNKSYTAVTSGSTGTPFSVIHDRGKRFRNTADVLYFSNLSKYSLGNKLFYLKIWNDKNRKKLWEQWVQNITPIDVFKLNHSSIQNLFFKIGSLKEPVNILSYASSLDLFAKFIKKSKNVKPLRNIKSIIAMSEALDSKTKKTIQKFLRCPVLSRYSNIENGIIAQQVPGYGNNFRVNWASYHVEILDLKENKPLKNGCLGRIVVTDLFNRAMPMIRYDTGDLGIMNTFIDENGKVNNVLSSVEGRKMDAIYDTDNELVSSFVVTNSMWKYLEIDQYQFIQIAKDKYLFKLNLKKKFTKEKKLIKEFKKFLGADAQIEVEYVKEIPLLSSGKRKKVKNLYKPLKKVTFQNKESIILQP